MLLNQGHGGRLREILIAVGLAAIFSQFGFLVFVLTVPLYTLYYRRGAKDLLIGSGCSIFLILIIAVWRTRMVDDISLRVALTVIEILFPVLLMLGMFFVIDIIPVLSGIRRLYKLLSATVAASVIFVPVFIMLQNNEVFMQAVTSQISAIGNVVLGGGSETYEGEMIKTYMGEDGLIGYMKSFYSRSVAAMYFVVLLISARISEMVLHRMYNTPVLRLYEFKVPDLLLWPAMLMAVGMLVEVFELFSFGYASPIIWNAGIILLFIYGLQGMGIIRSLFLKYNLPNGLRVLVEMVLILLLIVPGVNYVVIIGLPVFGISETWINLRKFIRST